MLVYALGEDDLAIVVNASNREKIVAWILEHLDGADVNFTDDTFSLGMIALQGPNAIELISPHVDFIVSKLGYYRCANATVLDLPVLISRTGYTGEDGLEFILPVEKTAVLWERLMRFDGGNVTACGLGCRDTLRLEAAMPLYGHELSEEIDPITAGLSFAVALDKDFIGRDAIARIAEQGPNKRAGRPAARRQADCAGGNAGALGRTRHRRGDIGNVLADAASEHRDGLCAAGVRSGRNVVECRSPRQERDGDGREAAVLSSQVHVGPAVPAVFELDTSNRPAQTALQS